jgi:hypothetical protein
MLPFDTSASPGAAGVLCDGTVRPCGVMATLIELASQNYLSLHAQEKGRFCFKIEKPSAVKVNLRGSKKSLLSWLTAWEIEGSLEAPPFQQFWGTWVNELGRELITDHAFDEKRWARLSRRRLFPAWTSRYVPTELHRYWKEVAKRLAKFPSLTDPLPETRLEWDTLFAYATALGQGELFLRHVRQVCEYYETRFQGVVMTFYTPHWFIHHRAVGEERFTFLTEGLAGLVSSFNWRRFQPLEAGKREVEV